MAKRVWHTSVFTRAVIGLLADLTDSESIGWQIQGANIMSETRDAVQRIQKYELSAVTNQSKRDKTNTSFISEIKQTSLKSYKHNGYRTLSTCKVRQLWRNMANLVLLLWEERTFLSPRTLVSSLNNPFCKQFLKKPKSASKNHEKMLLFSKHWSIK